MQKKIRPEHYIENGKKNNQTQNLMSNDTVSSKKLIKQTNSQVGHEMKKSHIRSKNNQ